MSRNRNLVYFIRKHLPDNQALHNVLAAKQLRNLRRQLISEKDVALGEAEPSRIPEIIEKYRADRASQFNSLTSAFDSYLAKAGMSFGEAEYQEKKTQMLFNCLAYGFAPDEFVYYELDRIPLEEKKTYITDLDRKMMQYIMSDFKDLQYVFDKAATYEKFGRYYQRDEISVASSADFEAFREFAGKHEDLVIKQVSASCGQGITIEKVNRDDLRKQFDTILARGKCSIEERIVQSDVIARFNESSVNTLRVIMFNTQHGIVIGPCFFRTGRAGAVVDNGGAGGIFVGVDRNTGVLDTDGHDEYMNRYETHPTSGVRYKGFQLPDWDRCIALVREMGALVPKIGYIGWDLAYTDKGWVLVEANGGSQFLCQICYHKGFKPEVERYIADKNIYK